ncbi:type I restriction-modification system, M subunit [Escherichia coli]|uniref:Type I restriction-modification system, M subunit n=1 Tax=Escherichia coli TaxID=562 RepID=A0A376KWB3_ECOLX|nr:type I restriction-modification system, M subunit [Escherichia coli]
MFAHLAKSVAFETVVANDYNLSVSSYVEAKDTREIIDIAELNAELKNHGQQKFDPVA